MYLFRAVHYDWPEAYCVKFLRNLIPALRHGAKIIIKDSLVPEPGTLGLLAERNVRYV